MIGAVTLALYLLMSLFDAAILAGTAYLVGWCDWSAWWFVLSMLIIAGSNPRRLILAMHGAP